jgi:hypothetical protein
MRLLACLLLTIGLTGCGDGTAPPKPEDFDKITGTTGIGMLNNMWGLGTMDPKPPAGLSVYSWGDAAKTQIIVTMADGKAVKKKMIVANGTPKEESFGGGGMGAGPRGAAPGDDQEMKPEAKKEEPKKDESKKEEAKKEEPKKAPEPAKTPEKK